ncbi:MAG: hypothetical protein M1830_003136 [Pleopsidium flavum]|nr:MAG: hypothetical protein M1830_003136 [Pleopsidium flavum]
MPLHQRVLSYQKIINGQTMVYLSVGLLVASLSFLIYRHPPASWPPLLGPWRQKTGVATVGSAYSDLDEKTQLQAKVPQKKEENVTAVIEQPTILTPPSPSKKSTSSDSTPKAKPVETQQLSAIPSLSLNGTHSPLTDSLQTSPKPLPLQRSSPSPTKRPPTQTNTLQPTPTSMPPPPRPLPKPTRRAPPSPTPTTSLRLPQPRPSPASTLRALPTTTTTTSLAPTTSTQAPSQRKSKKVLLAPGHSPLDWAVLTKSPSATNKLRGANLPAYLIRVPPSLLKRMNGRKGRDAWSVWQGKVYNITPYLPFHPGGEGELMRAAGREAGALFMEVHPWVNWEGMLGECLVGVLVDEGDEKGKGSLDEMD